MDVGSQTKCPREQLQLLIGLLGQHVFGVMNEQFKSFTDSPEFDFAPTQWDRFGEISPLWQKCKSL